MSAIIVKELELIEKLWDMNLSLHTRCNMLQITNEFLDEVREEDGKDQELQQIVSEWGTEKRKDCIMGKDGILRFIERVCTSQSGFEEDALG